MFRCSSAAALSASGFGPAMARFVSADENLLGLKYPSEKERIMPPGKPQQPNPSQSDRGKNPPGGGYGKGGKKENPLKPKPGNGPKKK